MVRAAGRHATLYPRLGLTLAIPVLLLGTIGCYVWGRELAGLTAGRLACWLYALSPTVLGWGPTALTDVAAAGVWIWSARALVGCWQHPSRSTAIRVGLWAGTAALVTFSGLLWLIAVVAIGIAALLTSVVPRYRSCRGQATAFLLAAAVAIGLINAGCLFDRTGFRLGEMPARSSLLLGRPNPEGSLEENRFAESPLGRIRVPLPMPYVQGLDLKQWRRENGEPTYFFGRYLEKSPWYFLPVALGLKLTPVELLLAVASVVAVIVWLCGSAATRRRAQTVLLMLLPCLVMSYLIMSGGGSLYRCWIPGFPFLVLAGVLALARLRHFAWIAAFLLGAQIVSMFTAFGHWHAYTNVFAVGARPGYYLGAANLTPDSRADYPYLKRWVNGLESHPEVYVGLTALADLDVVTRWKQTANWQDSAEVWLVYDVGNFLNYAKTRDPDVVAVIGGTLYVVRKRTKIYAPARVEPAG